MNKGLMKLLAVIMLSLVLAAISLMHSVSFDIDTVYVREVIIPNHVEKDWDDSFSINDKEDIAQIVQAVNALELHNEKTYTMTSFASVDADILKENLYDFIAFQYDIEQKDQIAFLQQYNLPAGVFILKDGHILANYVGENGVYYKLYRADSEGLLKVFDDVKAKYREMIFVEDVLQSLAIEGVRYEIMPQSDTFQQNWPNTTIFRLNDRHYLLLCSFPIDSEKRRIAQNECGWVRLAPLSEAAENAPFILDQMEQDFSLEDIDVIHVAYLNHKNMAAQLIPVIRHDMTPEENDALNKENILLFSALKRIFTES